MKCGRMNLKIPKKGKNFTGIPKYRTNHLLGHKTIYLQKPKQHANIRKLRLVPQLPSKHSTCPRRILLVNNKVLN